MVGAPLPPQIGRREIQQKFNKRMCESCRNAPPCKMRNNCAMCNNWCLNENTPESSYQPESIVGSPIESVPHHEFLNSNPTQPTDVDVHQEQTNIFPIMSRSNIVGSSEKTTYNVDNNIIQPMKGSILRLLGMSDIRDAEDMGMWVTTLSNNPPSFETRNNAEKIINLCRNAGSELQEEAQESVKNMASFMWSQLQEELKSRIQQIDNTHITKGEMANIVEDIFKRV